MCVLGCLGVAVSVQFNAERSRTRAGLRSRNGKVRPETVSNAIEGDRPESHSASSTDEITALSGRIGGATEESATLAVDLSNQMRSDFSASGSFTASRSCEMPSRPISIRPREFLVVYSVILCKGIFAHAIGRDKYLGCLSPLTTSKHSLVLIHRKARSDVLTTIAAVSSEADGTRDIRCMQHCFLARRQYTPSRRSKVPTRKSEQSLRSMQM